MSLDYAALESLVPLILFVVVFFFFCCSNALYKKRRKTGFEWMDLSTRSADVLLAQKCRNYICSGESRLQVTELKNGPIPDSFSLFLVLSTFCNWKINFYRCWDTNHSANCATTTANSGDRVQIDVPCYQGAKPEVPFTSSCSIRESKQHLSWAQCYNQILGGWIPKINIFSQNYISRDNKQKNNLTERWAH